MGSQILCLDTHTGRFIEIELGLTVMILKEIETVQ